MCWWKTHLLHRVFQIYIHVQGFSKDLLISVHVEHTHRLLRKNSLNGRWILKKEHADQQLTLLLSLQQWLTCRRQYVRMKGKKREYNESEQICFNSLCSMHGLFAQRKQGENNTKALLCTYMHMWEGACWDLYLCIDLQKHQTQWFGTLNTALFVAGHLQVLSQHPKSEAIHHDHCGANWVMATCTVRRRPLLWQYAWCRETSSTQKHTSHKNMIEPGVLCIQDNLSMFHSDNQASSW